MTRYFAPNLKLFAVRSIIISISVILGSAIIWTNLYLTERRAVAMQLYISAAARHTSESSYFPYSDVG